MYIYIGTVQSTTPHVIYGRLFFMIITTRDTTFTYLPWSFFLTSKLRHIYDYDTISSVLVEKCHKNPGITLRDVRG